MKVLFTCVGKSDPLTIFRNEKVYDAAFLHIARKFQPEKIYFYMSQEICELDDLDNRYEKSIKLLNQHLNTNIEIHKEKRPNLIEVQRFDEFYDDFETIIKQILDENGESVEILCNVSSGTPAMKATLQILASLSKYKIIPIQVTDPTKGKSNIVRLEGYDLDFYWELNEDNHNYEDRTYLSKNDKFNFKIQKELMINLINSYDYEAAYNLASNYKHRIDKGLLNLLKFALNRYKLDSEVILNDYNRFLLPYQEDDKAKLFEYGLLLKLKKEKGEIVDFLRGLTPFLYTVCQWILVKKFDLDLTKYCDIDDKGIIHLTRKKLEVNNEGKAILKILDNSFKGYRNSFLSEKQMIYILYEKLDDDSELCLGLRALDNLRKKKRNIASHQITCIREDDLIGDLNKSMDDYVNCIKTVLSCLDFDIQNSWNSYEKMNKKIIQQLNKLR
ncbi:type III-A CRISPR-associated CARF protein Csm6 [Thomasclavelia cocleata]|uniref:type III-A CRISPR-associated CARF protein Csm6 n=1 Tax=Thomasclavelia cocleata TaxID=69824 RepID=UPI00242DDF49|nr:hypothetical protein [Thomasclavelia cocleata]